MFIEFPVKVSEITDSDLNLELCNTLDTAPSHAAGKTADAVVAPPLQPAEVKRASVIC